MIFFVYENVRNSLQSYKRYTYRVAQKSKPLSRIIIKLTFLDQPVCLICMFNMQNPAHSQTDIWYNITHNKLLF